MLVPSIPTALVKYGAAVALGAVCAWWVQGLRWEADAAARDTAAATLALNGLIQVRAAESATRDHYEKVAQDAREEATRLAADAAGARRSADGLRKQLDAYVSAAGGTAAADGSAATCPAAGVLARMLERLDGFAGAVAAHADAATVAGRACEATQAKR